jgi:hypothetical protein
MKQYKVKNISRKAATAQRKLTSWLVLCLSLRLGDFARKIGFEFDLKN